MLANFFTFSKTFSKYQKVKKVLETKGKEHSQTISFFTLHRSTDNGVAAGANEDAIKWYRCCCCS
jgi:hypothetical protein